MTDHTEDVKPVDPTENVATDEPSEIDDNDLTQGPTGEDPSEDPSRGDGVPESSVDQEPGDWVDADKR